MNRLLAIVLVFVIPALAQAQIIPGERNVRGFQREQENRIDPMTGDIIQDDTLTIKFNQGADTAPATATAPRKAPARGAKTYEQTSEGTVSTDGTAMRTEGDTTYLSDGTSYKKVGDTMYGSNGINYKTVGDTIYGSDGSITKRVGDTSYSSSGKRCKFAGGKTHCDYPHGHHNPAEGKLYMD